MWQGVKVSLVKQENINALSFRQRVVSRWHSWSKGKKFLALLFVVLPVFFFLQMWLFQSNLNFSELSLLDGRGFCGSYTIHNGNEDIQVTSLTIGITYEKTNLYTVSTNISPMSSADVNFTAVCGGYYDEDYEWDIRSAKGRRVFLF
ncbi:MAG: hypothetical protein ACR2NQ_05475 [Thermodesulfobacteriota bacterium]